LKAITQDTYGSADVLHYGDVPTPSPGRGEVVVAVEASGVDRGAWHFMTGQPYLMRILGFGLRAPKSPVPGTNIAGRIESIGPEVSRFRVGDEVYGRCRGAWAEYARASEDQLAPKPANLSFAEASVMPYGCFVAWQAVHDHGHVDRDKQVLVVGATGAVGCVVVQLAKAAGAVVAGVCSGRSADLARSLGLDRVIDYHREDFTDGTSRYDIVIDVFGRTSVSRLRHALTRSGRLVIVGGEGDRWIGGIQRQLWAAALSPFVSQKLGAFVVKEDARYLLDVNPLIESGLVAPVMDRTYPLIDAPDAVRRLESGQALGRIALAI